MVAQRCPPCLGTKVSLGTFFQLLSQLDATLESKKWRLGDNKPSGPRKNQTITRVQPKWALGSVSAPRDRSVDCGRQNSLEVGWLTPGKLTLAIDAEPGNPASWPAGRRLFTWFLISAENNWNTENDVSGFTNSLGIFRGLRFAL